MSLAPTPKLRWVTRAEGPAPESETAVDGRRRVRILQQWWAADVPSYMRGTEGEWRDVSEETET